MKRTGLRRTLLIGVLAFGALLVGATIASADHSWNGYHWPDGNLSPTVVNESAPTDVFDVPAAVQEWAALATPIQPGMASGSTGDVEVVMKRMNARWLGVARIWVGDADHIQRGRVELNQLYLNSLTLDEWDHVLCQELGHIWGLGHNPDGATGGTLDDTCMNGAEHLGDYTSPNSHDTDQLNLIYNHTDVSDGGGDDGGDGGNCPPGNPNHKNCLSAGGRWITVHVFPAP